MKNNKLNINSKKQSKMNVTKNVLIDYDNDDKWKEGIKVLESDFSKIVEMTEKAYEHFLNCLPPLRMMSNSFLSSEPFTHNEEGKGIYLAAAKIGNKYYAQMSTLKDFDMRKLFK